MLPATRNAVIGKRTDRVPLSLLAANLGYVNLAESYVVRVSRFHFAIVAEMRRTGGSSPSFAERTHAKNYSRVHSLFDK